MLIYGKFDNGKGVRIHDNRPSVDRTMHHQYLFAPGEAQALWGVRSSSAPEDQDSQQSLAVARLAKRSMRGRPLGLPLF